MPLIKSVSGVRGIVDPACGEEVTLTPQIAADFGSAFATYLRSQGSGSELVLVGARDGRPGGGELLAAFARGVGAMGGSVLDLGVVTTPGAALAVDELAGAGCVCGGVVITASHNPQQWNGIKLMLPPGRAPTAAEADKIIAIFDAGDFERTILPDDALRPSDFNVHERHVAKVLATVDVPRIRQHKFRVVLDSVNGSGGRAGRMLLEELGCDVVALHAEPDQGFPRTPEPTAENLAEFCRQVAGAGVHVGFAQDPDADRLAIVDESGRYIGEEYTLALCALDVFARRPGPIVANLSTSRMIDDLAQRFGGLCCVHRSAVGEANVVEKMREVGATFGGEGNGGVIDANVVYVRDSLVGMALTLQLLADESARDGGGAVGLSTLVDSIPSYAFVKEKVTADREGIDGMLAAIRRKFASQQINDLDGLRIDWPDGWVHVRASNTEPIMRIIAEAADEAAAHKLIERVRAVM
jgi:phosphomannomutase